MKKSIISIALITLLASLLSASLLTRGHLWWDDFASYIMQAQSILNGSEQDFITHNAISIEQSSFPVGPVAYPWGFPLLITPFYAIFGLNILALKLVNILFFGFFLGIFYLYLQKKLPQAFAAVLTGFLAFNPTLLEAHDLLLSDIPFLFFSTLGIYLMPSSEQVSRQKQFWLGLTLFAASFIRTNGVLLVGTLIAADLIHSWPAPRRIWRSLRRHAITYLTFTIAYSASLLIFPGGQTSYFSHYELFNLPRLLDNGLYYLSLPNALFDHFPAQLFLYLISGLLFLIGVGKSIRKEMPVLIYLATTLALFISWPERQGLRFIFPLLPFFVYFAYVGGQTLGEQLKPSAQKIAEKVHWLGWGGLALTGLVISLGLGSLRTGVRPEINGPFDAVSTEMFEYIRNETPQNSLVVFFKPRAMRLFTERDAIMLTECERLSEVNYVVLSEKVQDNEQLSPEKITTCNSSVQVVKVFKNKRFSVYEIMP